MTFALVLVIVWAVLGGAALVLFVCMLRVRRAGRPALMEAWRAERERATAALDSGWRNEPTS